MSGIIKRSLRSSDIQFLNSSTTLYTFDLRGTNESPEQEIPDFWKYENPMPWILHNQYVAVNEDYHSLPYSFQNKMVIAPKESDPRISIFERLENKVSQEITSLWVGVPHPQADLLAQSHHLSLNYLYADFVRYSDKIAQKKALEGSTPRWIEIRSKNELLDLPVQFQKGFLKRQQGSGGYKIYLIDDVIKKGGGEEFFSQDIGWYAEERVEGNSYSIQCLKEGDEIVIFGFDQQLIADQTHFIGARILSFDDLQGSVYQQLEVGIEKIQSLLHDYRGFFGVDFIIDAKGLVHILEANVRMTAMTMPVIIAVDRGLERADFLEDIALDKIKKEDVIIMEDLVRKTADILRKI